MLQKFDSKKMRARQSAKFTLNRRRRGVLSSLLFVIASVSLVYALSELSAFYLFNIQKVIVTGADDDIKGSLTAAAYTALEGNYARLFAKSNIFLYPKDTIEAAVKNASVRVDGATVKVSGWDTLLVAVSEKKPAALFCSGLPDFEAGGDCYFADADGTAYMKAPTFSETAFNRFFIPDLQGSATSSGLIGVVPVRPETFRKLQLFYDGARKGSFDVLGILVGETGEYEMYIKTDSANSGRSTDPIVVYFNEKNGLEEELSNLISFWSFMQSSARSKGQKISFDSIDLRYGSNVFYRLSQ